MKYEAVYVHIPFCKQKCLYCDFPSYAGFSCDAIEAYVQALCEEIRLRSFETDNVGQSDTIFFGGGTPSILPIESLNAIVTQLKTAGFWKNPREATIEVNPGTADFEKIKALREIGFDRISFGVQSLNDSELRTIGRIHSAEEALTAIEMAKKAGFTRINADIMYGLPGQNITSLNNTLETIISTNVEHISAYSLILEEGTPLDKLVSSGKLSLPDEDETADMYDFVQEFLSSRGYERYEVSNYARDGAESEHNKVYWAYHPYMAFGAAACSFNGRSRMTATDNVENYIEAVKQLSKAKNSSIYINNELYDMENLTECELVAEFMFMGLRTVRGANLQESKERFGIDVLHEFAVEMEPFFRQKLLIYDEKSNYLRLTESGMAVGNIIFEAFIK